MESRLEFKKVRVWRGTRLVFALGHTTHETDYCGLAFGARTGSLVKNSDLEMSWIPALSQSDNDHLHVAAFKTQ